MAGSRVGRYLPPPADVAELPVDELAFRILRLVVLEGLEQPLLSDMIANPGVWEQLGHGSNDPEFLRAIHEAFWWLRNHGLVVPKVGDGGPGWCIPTRLARRAAEDTDGLRLIQAGARLDIDLHPLLARRIRRQFTLGEYELAVFAAMKTVEVRVRELAGLGDEAYGVPLMRKAFDTDGGPLADMSLHPAERDAVGHLYAGAIGLFKNPTSHRTVDFDDPTFASEVILFADLLLRMLER